MSLVWLLLCIATLLINVWLIVAVIGLVVGVFYAPFRAAPYGVWLWAPAGWGAIVVAIIWSFLFYPHCGFLRLPFGG